MTFPSPKRTTVEVINGEGTTSLGRDFFNEEVIEMIGIPRELSVRARNCLKNLGIKDLAELGDRTEDDVLRIHNLGKKTFNEILDWMHLYRINFKVPMEKQKRPVSVGEFTVNEITVLAYKYGIFRPEDNPGPQKRKTAAEHLRLSVGRIRQIEDRAERKVWRAVRLAQRIAEDKGR